MIEVAGAVTLVWVALLGSAYLVRSVLAWEPRSAIIAVLGCYGVLLVLDLAWFGGTWPGLAGAVGMLLPCAAALALCALPWRGEPSA